MAVCPQCGSSDITLKRDTDINWGRALVGWAAFGVVGGAVAGVTGQDRNAVTCLDCGATWRAADIYKVIQILKEATGLTLDLRNERHRQYLALFIERVTPYFDEISTAEQKAIRVQGDVIKTSWGAGFLKGLYVGLALGILCLFFIGSEKSSDGTHPMGFIAFLFLVGSPALGALISHKAAIKSGWTQEKVMLAADKKAEVIRIEARDRVFAKIQAFTKEKPIPVDPPRSKLLGSPPPPPPPPPPLPPGPVKK